MKDVELRTVPLSEIARNAEDVFSPDGTDYEDEDAFDIWMEKSDAEKTVDLYLKSDCDDFSHAMNIVTGYPVVEFGNRWHDLA